MRIQTRRSLPLALLTIAVTVAGLTACASTPEVDTPLGRSSLGSVFLERIPDRSFQAAHPATLSPTLLQTALEGILIEDAHISMSALLSNRPQPLRALSDAEAAFLAPLLSDGLRQAAADQQVGFTLVHQNNLFSLRDSTGAGVGSNAVTSPSSAHETSSGSVFVHGRSLHIQFHQLRMKPERSDAMNMPNRQIPDRTGLIDHTLSFTPPSARRPSSYVIRGDAAATLVLDYEQIAGIASAPPATAAPVPPQVSKPAATPIAPIADRETDVRALQEQMREKDRELESVRKELQDIRQQLKRQPPPATNRTK
ncbi:MAG: conserved exported protein of unknown function [Nitrospira sp.]|nr:MAG: conserved exported protein of unknown function [Nitrospira sp.]